MTSWRRDASEQNVDRVCAKLVAPSPTISLFGTVQEFNKSGHSRASVRRIRGEKFDSDAERQASVSYEYLNRDNTAIENVNKKIRGESGVSLFRGCDLCAYVPVRVAQHCVVWSVRHSRCVDGPSRYKTRSWHPARSRRRVFSFVEYP